MFHSIDRASHAIITARALALLAPLEAELGVKFSGGGGVLGNATGVVKLNVAIVESASGVDARKAEFERQARMYGYDPKAYGQLILHNGSYYKFMGFAPNRPKFFIQSECVATGKTMFFTRAIAKKIPCV